MAFRLGPILAGVSAGARSLEASNDKKQKEQMMLEDRMAQKEMRDLQKRTLEQALLPKPKGPEAPVAWETRETADGVVQVNPRTGEVRPLKLEDRILQPRAKEPPTPQRPVGWQTVRTAKGYAQVNPETGETRDLGLQPEPREAPEPKAPPQPADGERKAAAMLERIRGVKQDLSQFDSQSTLDALSGKAGIMGNWTTTAEGRRLRAAGRIWVMSVLRPESGATIGDKELDSYFETYLPRPRDDEMTLAFKRRQREIAERAVEVQAGRALTAPQQQFTVPNPSY